MVSRSNAIADRAGRQPTPTHLGTFLVEPGTYRVAFASGYCGPVPIASYRGPGTGCSI